MKVEEDFFIIEFRRLNASLNKVIDIYGKSPSDADAKKRISQLKKRISTISALLDDGWLDFYNRNIKARESLDRIKNDLIKMSEGDDPYDFPEVNSSFLIGRDDKLSKELGSLINSGGFNQIKDPKVIEEIANLMRTDFRWYAKYVLKIRPREGAKYIPFVLNPPQEYLTRIILYLWSTGQPVRVNVLKCRQWGCSTLVSALLNWLSSNNPHQSGLITVDTNDHNQNMKLMHDKFYEERKRKFGSLLTPMRARSNANEIVFDNPKKDERHEKPGLNSRIKFESAQSSSAGTSSTYNLVHLSECSKYPANKAREANLSVLQTVPKKRGTLIVRETTADAKDTVFEEAFRNSVKGLSDYVPVFIPWDMVPEYSMKIPLDEEFELITEGDENIDHWGDEVEIRDTFGLTMEQMYWRRKTIINECANSLEEFQQEYPIYWEEAFRAASGFYFNRNRIAEYIESAKKPIFRGDITIQDEDLDILIHKSKIKPVLIPNRRGMLCIYQEPKEDEKYYIGTDVSTGEAIDDPDASSICVINSNGRLVAVFNGLLDPDELSRKFAYIAVYYEIDERNPPKINCEENNVGFIVCKNMERMGFINIYTKPDPRKIAGIYKKEKWFTTNDKNKEIIFSQLKSAIREDKLEIHDLRVLNELAIVVRKENGKLEARDGYGNHDDNVIALAIALETLIKEYGEFNVMGKESSSGKVEEQGSGFDINKNYAPGTIGDLLKRNLVRSKRVRRL